MIVFEWDDGKARSNLKKHGVSFAEAESVFYDDQAIQFYEELASDEDRFILLGMSRLSRVLVVVHCERGVSEQIIRIISARRATNSEQQYYRGGR